MTKVEAAMKNTANKEWMRARLSQASAATARPSGKQYTRKKRSARRTEE